jgi:hypothetical protein
MSSKQLDTYTTNNVRLTLAEIFRNDQFGEWSFKEIGFRLEPAHPKYVANQNNFELVHIPRSLNYQKTWEITKKLLNKNKNASEIQNLLNYIDAK